MPRKPKVSRPVEFYGPPVQEVTLYWVDSKVRTAVRRKVHPIHGKQPSQVSCARGTLANPGVARFEHQDKGRILQWLRDMRAQGWVNEAELEEMRTLRTILIRAAVRNAGGGKTYDPASIANKKSGKGEKPMRKPIRDRQAPASVRNNGTIVSRTINGFKQVV
jgi:hypothetical protein